MASSASQVTTVLKVPKIFQTSVLLATSVVLVSVSPPPALLATTVLNKVLEQ